jgi:DNA polymerase III alpha subunit
MKEKLVEICHKALDDKGLGEEYRKRLGLELKEIDNQNEYDYFLELYEKKVRYAENENNLLVPYLLGIVDNFDISKEGIIVYGDFPDCDQDFIPEVQKILKNEWAPRIFGKEYVANIGSYNTFGIKSALISMARVFDKSRSEILDLTTKISLKDDEGKAITWDKAMEMYPALKQYCETNPEVADAAKKLLNRNNSMGKHAGGLIISSKPIDQFVPLVKGNDGQPLSAWVEGLHGQDLGPVGLIKFDLLVITNLVQIALAARLIRERYGIETVCALPGQSNWSDISYLNDPKALELAKRGELKCIFQFDSDGIRKLTKDGGVDSFEDLVAYTSLYRPSCLDVGMHERYIERKRGREDYEIHPLLQPILGKTYNVMLFQEQVMKILNIVGDIPLKDCEIVRKAISKKKISIFAKYKEMFIRNGQKNLGWTEEQVSNLFDQVESFSGYGFNLSHATSYTLISSRLLWLKAHYPLEFFTAILACEDATEKIKEYKLEASKYQIEVMPVDINKSGTKVKIVDEKVYLGFANVKGIGDAVVQRIVDNQPYKDLPDFLNKFGTDASVVKPLIGLRVFDGDPITLYKYYEWFKGLKKKKTDRRKRYEVGQENKIKTLLELLPEEWHDLANFSPDSLIKLEERYKEAVARSLDGQYISQRILDFIQPWMDDKGKMHDPVDYIRGLYKKYQRSADTYNKKVEEEVTGEFKPEEIEIDDELARIYMSVEESEKAFYGFLWTHPLEKSSDYKGNMTFEAHRAEGVKGPVEVFINKVEEKESKKKTKYYLLNVEDSNSEVQEVQVWMDDWYRFKDDLVEGNMVRIQVKPPDGGFRRYTLDSPPRHLRYKLPKDKKMDIRVVVMKRD